MMKPPKRVHLTCTDDTPNNVANIIEEVGEDAVFTSIGQAIITIVTGGKVSMADGVLLELLDIYYDVPKD